MKLNLEAKNKQEEIILAFLQANASDALADQQRHAADKRRKKLYKQKDAFGVYEIRLRRSEKTRRKRRELRVRGRFRRVRLGDTLF